jgi:hypothetical protein
VDYRLVVLCDNVTEEPYLQGGGNRSYDTEVTQGFNSIFTYRGLPGQVRHDHNRHHYQHHHSSSLS